MPVNFDKYQRDLVTSWKEVVNEKNDTNWAVYGYENQTDTIELVATGNGLEDLADQFTISRIMYAFCRYQSANSDLPKFFIINWQGEGAPPARKMACANHINDVAKFFRGANMTIEARNEDDVEPTSIIKKLERISIHSFNLRERSIVENVSPVGTNYKRIQPQKEIDVVKRETFWSQVQEEETKRRLEEKKRIEEERITLEKMLVEKQLDEASEEKITVIRSTKTEIKTEKDIKKEFDRSKLGVRSVADDQWIKVKGDEIENGQNNGSNSDEVKASSYVKSRVESFKKAFEEGKPPIQAEKPIRKIRESVLSKNNSNNESSESKNQPKVDLQSTQNTSDQLNDTFKAKVKIMDESEQELSCKKDLRNGIAKQVADSEIQVEEKVDKESTMKTNLPSKIEQTLNVESNVIATPSPEPGPDHGDDVLNAEIHETEEELNDKQSEDILNAEELEDEEFDVYKMWKPSDLVFSSTNLESDENHYFTVKSSYLDTLEDIAEEAEENIEEEEGGREEEEEEEGEKASDQTEEQEDESEAERKFIEEAEKRFPKSEYGLRARALYDYQAADETEITFDPDDIITHIEQVDVGWWQGMAPDGTYGLFPANYVQLIG